MNRLVASTTKTVKILLLEIIVRSFPFAVRWSNCRDAATKIVVRLSHRVPAERMECGKGPVPGERERIQPIRPDYSAPAWKTLSGVTAGQAFRARSMDPRAFW